MQTIKNSRGGRNCDSGARAFTFTDLLVVVAVLGLLLFVLIPAQADSRKKTRGVRCLDNQRQIMAAFLMYTHDNHDLFPPNPDDGNTITGHRWCQGDAGVGQDGEFNPDLLANPQRCLITTYLNTNISLFRCAADTRAGIYRGSDPKMIGVKIPAVRIISMNQAVGTICPGLSAGGGHSGKPVVPVHGPWLNGQHSHRMNSPYRTYGRLGDMIAPGPAMLWVIIEEDPRSLNDAGFGLNMNSAEWIDFPGMEHGGSGMLGFADGHAELHRWVDPRTRVPTPVMRVTAAGSADWEWLRARTSALVQ